MSDIIITIVSSSFAISFIFALVVMAQNRRMRNVINMYREKQTIQIDIISRADRRLADLKKQIEEEKA